MAGVVARRYAQALFELARDQGLVEVIDEQAALLEAVFADKQVQTFFASQRIGADEKKRVIDRQLGVRLHALLANLLKLLVDKRRIERVIEIMREYNRCTNEYRGIEEVAIVSAVPLSEEQKRTLSELAKRFTKYEHPRIHFELAPGVIGGVKIRLGEHTVFDGTLSSRLQQMRDKLYRFRHRGMGA